MKLKSVTDRLRDRLMDQGLLVLELLSQLKIIQHSNYSERGWGGGRQGLRLPLSHRHPQGGGPGVGGVARLW